MLLYPILRPAQYYELTDRGRLTGRWRHVDPDFVPAYHWIVAAMLRRGIDTRGRPPVWAWHSYDPPRKRKPDLRSSRYLTIPGTRAVRLVVEAPDHMVLLSGYDVWHSVLNKWHLSLSEAEADRVDHLEARGRLTRQAIESSWERIFDLNAGDPDWLGKPAERAIQACLPHIDAAWIREATRFVARRTPEH